MQTSENELIDNLKKNVRESHGEVNSVRWKLLKDRVEGRILDVGCARGAYVKKLCALGYDAYGTDVLDFSETWRKDGESFGKRFSVMRENEFPFKEGEFDTALLFDVLEHIRDVDLFLGNLVKIVRKRLILSVPNAEDSYDMRRAGLAYHHYVDTSHVNFFSEGSLAETLGRHGLRVGFMKRILPINSLYLFLRSLYKPTGIAKFLSKANRLLPAKHHLSIFVVAEKEMKV